MVGLLPWNISAMRVGICLSCSLLCPQGWKVPGTPWDLADISGVNKEVEEAKKGGDALKHLSRHKKT